MPLISCVMPVHDGERYLAAAIESVVAQDHRPLEIVVVDDGSTDASAAVAEAFGDPVRVVRQQLRGGAAARNRGILETRGDFLAFLDADDLYRPGKLSAQLSFLDANLGADLCLCVGENFWEPGLELEEARYRAFGRMRATHTFGAMLARRSAFDRAGLLDETRKFGEQVEWFLRAGDAGLVAGVLDRVLLDRRMHAASRSRNLGTMDSYFELVARRIERRRTQAS